ncbi:MAG: HlyD family efflux transporter periplasmic adaptor subunit [Finegoldia sp.]|nr:HlyD family efflux transporter periplasmic adaptor subunit [Finegoldia sp.]
MRKKMKISDTLILFIFLIIAFFVVHNLYINFIKYRSYNLSEKTSITTSYPTKAMVVRDEYGYLTNYKINEFSNVRQPIGSFISSDIKNYNDNLMSKDYIKARLLEIETLREKPLKNEDKIEDGQVDDLIDNINKKDYSSDLITNYYNFVNLSEEETFYIRDKLNISLYVKENNGEIYSKNSGVFVSKLDNLNGLISYNSKHLLKDDFFLRDSQDIKEYPGLNIVNSMDCFFTFTIKADSLNKNLQNNQVIKFKYKNKTYTAYINSLNYNDDKTLSLLVRLEEGINDFLQGRYFDLELLDSNYNSFKIPKKSIIKRSGQDGVFVKNPVGVSKFYPVEIIRYEGSYAYINSGISGKIKINNKEMETVELNDEIFVHPKLIEEGELVN